jgi:hypothetical protein
MCEHCGCQALQTIDELTREHDAVLGHVRTAELAAAAGDLPGAVAACCALDRLLVPHSAVEEEGVFPALAREYPEHVAGLVDEHRVVHGALAEVAAAGADDLWAPGLLHALAVLRAHIAKEQDGLFPASLSSLTTADWESAERVRRRVGSTAF